MTAKVISILNEKGGSGKTNTTINLGRGLQIKGYEVVIFDNDPQRASVEWKNNSREPETCPTVVPIDNPITKNDVAIFSEKVDFILIDGMPGLESDKRLEDATGYLNELTEDDRIPEDVRVEIIQRVFKILGPSRTAQARNTAAIALSDFVVLASKASPLDKRLTIRLALDLIKPTREMLGKPDYAVLINQSKQKGLIIEKNYRKELKGKMIETLQNTILEREIYKAVYDLGSTVLDKHMNTDAANEINAIVDEILCKLGVGV